MLWRRWSNSLRKARNREFGEGHSRLRHVSPREEVVSWFLVLEGPEKFNIFMYTDLRLVFNNKELG